MWSTERAVNLIHLLSSWNCNVKEMFLGSPMAWEGIAMQLWVLEWVRRGSLEPDLQQTALPWLPAALHGPV